MDADALVDCNIGKEDDDKPILFKTFLYHRHDTLEFQSISAEANVSVS